MDASSRAATEHPQQTGRREAFAGLRVALVHDWLTGRRGGEKCLEVLCQAFPDATLHTLIHRPGVVGPAIDRMDIRTSPLQRLPGVFRHYRHLLPVMPLAARSWRLDQADLVISLSHCVAKAARVPAGVPHVCYCFTPMRYAWDGRAAYLDSWTGRPFRKALVGRLLDRLRDWDRATAASVTHFIAISRTVSDRIARCYGRPSRIIQPPVDTAFYTPGDATREDHYLCVSALVPYKRIDHAIRACMASGRKLVIIGSGPDRDRLERLAGPTVQFLGWQPDTVVRDHLRRCRALLFPGEEDFGIVPVEALACGSPVIALGRGGAAETINHQVGRLFEESDPDCLVATLDAWEADGCPHDPGLARARAEALSIPVYRERMLAFLEDVMIRHRTARAPAPHFAVGLPKRERRRRSTR